MFMQSLRDGKKIKFLEVNILKPFTQLILMVKSWRAISWTTAASLVSVIEMIQEGLLEKEGFIKQEEIPFDKFLKTDAGKLFLD